MTSLKSLEAEARQINVRIVYGQLAGDLQGAYADRLRLIAIDDTLNDCQRKCALQHELIHAIHHDTLCDNRSDCKQELRARRQTAQALITPTAYGLAEFTYEGDLWHMACDLDVTMQVLTDYRALLADQRDIRELMFV